MAVYCWPLKGGSLALKSVANLLTILQRSLITFYNCAELNCNVFSFVFSSQCVIISKKSVVVFLYILSSQWGSLY